MSKALDRIFEPGKGYIIFPDGRFLILSNVNAVDCDTLFSSITTKWESLSNDLYCSDDNIDRLRPIGSEVKFTILCEEVLESKLGINHYSKNKHKIDRWLASLRK